jgi:phosphoribosylaminoimidazolecarboxamide formyltransferase/IMP cyclohydrolase
VSQTVLDRVPIRRALISVYDKSGLEELAAGLHAAGVALVSTGSTAKRIAAAGIPVSEVEEVTGSPEMLDGRVKTLHPRVHGGILADRRVPAHMKTLEDMQIEAFDLVVVNLYPFVDTVRSGAAMDDVVEQIDIGGPAMVRSAAKNHAAVTIVVDPAAYGAVIAAAAAGGFDLKSRQRLAAKAFAHTAAYDTAVASWTAAQFLDEDGDGVIDWPAYSGLALERSEVLRYGENPHQQAALYVDKAAPAGIAQADQLHGKAMSYNNYVDADAALRAAFDFDAPAVAVIKHANPCGVAVASADAADPIADAHAKACHRSALGLRWGHRREPHRDRRHGQHGQGHFHRGRHRPGLRARSRGDPLQEEEHPPAVPARGLRPLPGRNPPGFRRCAGPGVRQGRCQRR